MPVQMQTLYRTASPPSHRSSEGGFLAPLYRPEHRGSETLTQSQGLRKCWKRHSEPHALLRPSVLSSEQGRGEWRRQEVGAGRGLTPIMGPHSHSPHRLRRIDAFSTGLWALLLGLHLAEQYLQAASPSWLDTLKFSTTSLCCLVGFTAAVATRKATGPRRFRPRRSEKQQ